MKFSYNLTDQVSSSSVIEENTTLPGALPSGFYQLSFTVEDGSGNSRTFLEQIVLPPAGSAFSLDVDGVEQTDTDGTFIVGAA